jgi:ATP-dependent DNA helicase RecG
MLHLAPHMDAHFRRQAAFDAIEAVRNGALACDLETEIVDFKEEADTVDHRGSRVSIPAQHEPAARALAEAVACLSMSTHGGVLIVGVNDKRGGRDAFNDTYLDLQWLRRQIHALTVPNLSIDMPEEIIVDGVRLYLINVPDSLSEIRVGGKLRARFETDCVELTGDRARQFLEQRRRYDWSAESAELRLSEVHDDALSEAHRVYAAAQGHRAGSALELVRRLNVAFDDTDDPVLSRAGALLLCAYEPDVERLDVQVGVAEGAPAEPRKLVGAPMITAFKDAWELIDRAFPARAVVVGTQRRSVRAIPEEALREALVNAIMHRDYRQPRAPIVALCVGDPAATLKVTSPGDFPEGVQKDRLLATRSQPRNPALAEAMRTLGYAERQGIGIPTMFRALLRDGHAQPEIYPEGGDVICRLPGGQVDTEIRRFFDVLYTVDTSLEYDVRAHIAITSLLHYTPLRVEQLADQAQCSDGEASDTLQRLLRAGSVERLLNGSRSFRLTNEARQALQSRLNYRQHSSLDESWDKVRAYLDTNTDIGRSEAAELLGVKEARASTILSALFNQRGVLQPVGNARGRGVRYRLSVYR